MNSVFVSKRRDSISIAYHSYIALRRSIQELCRVANVYTMWYHPIRIK